MNYIKMKFICNIQPNNNTLHSLYTTIRYKKEKESNEDELYQVWQDGKIIYIVMDKNKVENNNDFFSFKTESNQDINIKLINSETLINEQYSLGDYVYFRTTMSYSYKHYENKDSKKFKEACPVNMKGSFKEGLINGKTKSLKSNTFDYLEKATGLDFKAEIESDKIRFERVFTDEHLIKDNFSNKKILFKNIISIDAILKIKDTKLFERILIGSIGKKKNYGFGKCFIEKIKKIE